MKPITACCVLFLAVYTVAHQMAFMGLEWYETLQWERTQQVMHGESGTPWQYRLFTESIVSLCVYMADWVGVSRPVAVAFVAVRFVQNVALFMLALVFYRSLGIPLANGLFGIGLFAWGMGHALYDGDLTFNTYTDVSLFMFAGIAILRQRFYWLIPLMTIAPFNRETSGCIPFMLLFSQLQWRGGKPAVSRKVVLVFVVTLLQWALIVGGLRLVFGIRPYIVPTAGVEPILPLLTFNLTWWRTWVFLFATLGILPLCALASWKRWPMELKRFFLAVAPVWFPLHFMLAHAPETRLFLVPHALLFVPGALLGLQYGDRPSSAPASLRE